MTKRKATLSDFIKPDSDKISVALVKTDSAVLSEAAQIVNLSPGELLSEIIRTTTMPTIRKMVTEHQKTLIQPATDASEAATPKPTDTPTLTNHMLGTTGSPFVSAANTRSG